MATEIIMPKVDMVMETGTFMEWLKQEGQPVTKGEPLFIILTDKATIECEAPASGVLAGLNASPDQVIPVSHGIGYILAPGEVLPVQAAKTPPAQIAPAAAQSEPAVSHAPAETPVAAGFDKTTLIRATPLARTLAKELGVDLAQVHGRGPRGRIYQADVIEAQQRQKTAPSQAPGQAAARSTQPLAAAGELSIPLPAARLLERIPLKGVRAVAARRLAYSAASAPHIYLTLSVDMSEAVRLRERVSPGIEARLGIKLSYTALIAYAVARTLRLHPTLNSSLDGNEIAVWDEVHLGIATALGEELIVPVVRGADRLSLEEIATEMNRLLQAARARKLDPGEMSGSTFTISNLGMFGIEEFTAIINPPESSILAVGKMMDTPLMIEGQVTGRPVLKLTLGTDHRVNDGARSARFLNDLKAALENPYLLL